MGAPRRYAHDWASVQPDALVVVLGPGPKAGQQHVVDLGAGVVQAAAHGAVVLRVELLRGKQK